MSKLKYNTNAVTDLVIVDGSHLIGKIGDCKVEFKRRVNGWHVNFVIIIDGILLHDSTATEECKEAFERLMRAAWVIKDDKHAAARAKAIPELNKFITIL